MSRFYSALIVEMVLDEEGMPMTSRGGRQLYRLHADYLYSSDLLGMVIKVPAGFITDLASVPRIPLAYLALNDVANGPGVIHDFLYSTRPPLITRAQADGVLLEAMEVMSVPWIKRKAIYSAVRLAGSRYWDTA